MVLKIKWTKRAHNSFDKTVEYIVEEWSEKSAQKFIKKVNSFLITLEKHPEIGKIELKEKQIHGFVLSRYTTVFYRIKKNQIILLNFFDNRQNPSKK